MTDYSNEGYDEWLEALEAGNGYYLACSNGHGSLPPRRVCPHCGDGDLVETPLAHSGTIETYTVTNVASPSFADDTPYATAIVSFETVKLTGQVTGIDFDDIEVGMVVEPDVGRTETKDEPIVVFRPR